MDKCRVFISVCWLFAAGGTLADAGAESTKIIKKQHKLLCGQATLAANTAYLRTPDYEIQAVSQVIFLENKSKKIRKKLRLDSKAIKKSSFDNRRLLDSQVTEWTCIRATTGIRYILLWYTCTSMDEHGFCAGEGKEWARLLRVDGTALDAKYGRIDLRYDELYENLGIEKTWNKGKFNILSSWE